MTIEPIPHMRNLAVGFRLVGICAAYRQGVEGLASRVGALFPGADALVRRELLTDSQVLAKLFLPTLAAIPIGGYGGWRVVP